MHKGHNFFKLQESINHLSHMDVIKIFSKGKKVY